MNTDNVLKFTPGKAQVEGKRKGSSQVLKFRRKLATYPTLEQLMRNEAPNPPHEELMLMLTPGPRAAAKLAKYRADRDAVNLN